MKQQSILIIEKEEAIRESFQLIFQEEGYCCHVAKDEKEAKKLLASQPIEIILVDSIFANPLTFLQWLLSTYPQKTIIIMILYTARIISVL